MCVVGGLKVAPMFTEHDVRHWWVGRRARVCMCVVGGLKLAPVFTEHDVSTGG